MHFSRTLLLTGCLALGSALSAEEDQSLTLDQLPPAVKEALLKQANGAQISEIEAETKKGKTVYEAKFGDTEVVVDANGKVLSTKVDKEDDKDEDDEDKGEKGKGEKKSKKNHDGDKSKDGAGHKDEDEDEDKDEKDDQEDDKKSAVRANDDSESHKKKSKKED
jgi:hypothetical protein